MSSAANANVLILTPVKNAAAYLDRYFHLVQSLDYPKANIAIGMLESDSDDQTFEIIRSRFASKPPEFSRAQIWKYDLNFKLPPGVQRYDDRYQVARRTALAKARNHLLFNALTDKDDWVLWIDVDLISYSPQILQQLIKTDLDILQPDCVCAEALGQGRANPPSFDLNAWRDHGRLHMHDLRTEGALVELDSVGGSMLLVRADVHRSGLIFPAFPYGLENQRIRPRNSNVWHGEIETEGLGIMAHDMGIKCWGLTTHRTIHR